MSMVVRSSHPQLIFFRLNTLFYQLAKKIAIDIRTGQSAEITLMKKLLAKSK
jgi:hypothetical protein